MSPGPGVLWTSISRSEARRPGPPRGAGLGAAPEWKGGEGKRCKLRPVGLAEPGGGGDVESALEGPERAPGPAGVGREGRRVRRGRPALAGRRLQLSRAQNNGQAVGEEDWEEGSRVSRKGETKEPSADCHLHVTRSAPPAPSFFLPLVPAAVGLGERIVHTDVGFQLSAFGCSVGAPRTGGASTCGCDRGSRPWGGQHGGEGHGSAAGRQRGLGMPITGRSRPGRPSDPARPCAPPA